MALGFNNELPHRDGSQRQGVRLSGTLETQYNEWRSISCGIFFALETGLPADTPELMPGLPLMQGAR